jgi:hypothetical protein
MANSGVKIIKKLRKYINGAPTDETKDNVITDADYIPNHASSEDCPVGCDAIISGNYFINAQSTGSSVYADPTTTTSTSTTSTTTEPPAPVKEYLVTNLTQNSPAIIEYKDEYGVVQNVTLNNGASTSVISQIEPFRVSGTTEISVVAQSFAYTPTLTTSTTTLRQSTDYTIDNSASSQPAVVSLTQMGETEEIETEIKAGSSVKVTSDTVVTAVSGSPTITPSPSLVTPQADSYTIVNNDYYNRAVVGYRPYLSVSDEVLLSPRETLTIESQDVPTVSPSSESTNVSITAAGSPSQPTTYQRPVERICNQHTVYNDSPYIASFDYTDCNQQDQRIELQPRQSATVPAISAPTLVENPAITIDYAIDTIERTFGNSGSANPVLATTTSTTSSTTTTTTKAVNTRQEIVPDVKTDGNCGKHYEFKEVTQNTDSAPRWYPKTFKISVDDKTGSFDFISYDPGYVPVLYKVYDGSNLLLDRCIISDESAGKWISRAYTGFIDAGMSNSNANSYTYGAKQKTPDKLTRRRDYNPFGRKEKTVFTLNKVTRNNYITIQVYEPLHNGLDYVGGISHGAKFEIGCVR